MPCFNRFRSVFDHPQRPVFGFPSLLGKLDEHLRRRVLPVQFVSRPVPTLWFSGPFRSARRSRLGPKRGGAWQGLRLRLPWPSSGGGGQLGSASSRARGCQEGGISVDVLR